jgi:D-alanyl-lipoteichoic acid acyltransferase DltB (MBOAT superfamily)
MNFTSPIFIVFIVLFFSFWPFFSRKNSHRWFFLTLASFVFYGWWDWRFLFLITASGLLDFFCGLLIEKFPSQKKKFLILSVAGNMGSLSVFKYSLFFAKNLEILFQFFNCHLDLVERIPPFALILPVGISFYTFQSLSYTIDIYWGKLAPTRNVFHFFSYLSMFPQLVAGPIVRARDMLHQLEGHRKISEQQRWEALKLVVIGFFKKMVIADNLAPHIADAFNAGTPYASTCFWWVIITATGFQFYAEFSGYSDIAIGLAKFMGYHIKKNFDHPFCSISVQKFWTKWHISMYTWFRDYIFMPLGGFFCSKPRAVFNLLVTFAFSGIWHGASWNYVAWGLLLGFYTIVEFITRWPKKLRRVKFGKHISLLLTVMQLWPCMALFRGSSLPQSIEIIRLLYSFEGPIGLFIDNAALFYLGIFMLNEACVYFSFDPAKYFSPTFRKFSEVPLVSLMIVACIFLRGPEIDFVYFQF